MNDKGLIPQGQPACVFSQSIVDELSLHVLTSLGLVKDNYDSSVVDKKNQRTNGPVNAHLRSAAYTNKHV